MEASESLLDSLCQSVTETATTSLIETDQNIVSNVQTVTATYLPTLEHEVTNYSHDSDTNLVITNVQHSKEDTIDDQAHIQEVISMLLNRVNTIRNIFLASIIH